MEGVSVIRPIYMLSEGAVLKCNETKGNRIYPASVTLPF